MTALQEKAKGKREKAKSVTAKVAFFSLPFTLILALALRLLLWSQPLHQPANDEVEYITVARDLLAGHGDWTLEDMARLPALLGLRSPPPKG